MLDEELDSRFRAATALRDAGDLPGSRVILEGLAHEHPREFALWLALGGVQFLQRHFEAAEESLLIATDLRPHSELASLTLFHTLKHLGRLGDAFAEMRRFLAIRPESREYSLLREELGEFDAAGSE